MPRPVSIIAFGDNVVDCYPDRQQMFPGGNCLNHAVFARRAGADAAYAGAVSDDAAGDLIRQALIDEGVDVSLLRRIPGATAYCVIELRAGDRTFVGANLGVSIIAPSAGDLARLADADAVHTGRSSHVDAWLPLFGQRTRVSYDMATVHDAARIARVAPHCFLLSFSGGGLSQPEALALARLARDCGADWALVTRGDEGALLLGADGVFEAKIKPVEAVDTLGAGDTFIASVLVGLLQGQDPATILDRAAGAAAETCLVQGAFGHAAALAVDFSAMMSLDEIYRTTLPAPGPAAGA